VHYGRPATPPDYDKIFRENPIIIRMKKEIEEIQKFRNVEYEIK